MTRFRNCPFSTNSQFPVSGSAPRGRWNTGGPSPWEEGGGAGEGRAGQAGAGQQAGPGPPCVAERAAAGGDARLGSAASSGRGSPPRGAARLLRALRTPKAVGETCNRGPGAPQSHAPDHAAQERSRARPRGIRGPVPPPRSAHGRDTEVPSEPTLVPTRRSSTQSNTVCTGPTKAKPSAPASSSPAPRTLPHEEPPRGGPALPG